MDHLDMRMTRRHWLLLIAGAAAVRLTRASCQGEKTKGILMMAVSAETLAGADLNDARAAYGVWFREVASQFIGIRAELVPEVFLPSEELIRDVRQGSLDCYGVTALELEKIAALTDPDSLVLQDYLADGMEYVLLVHNSSPFKGIADLRNARIVSHHHRDMVLLSAWLGNLLAANNLPATEHFFASHELRDSLNMVVLPVFFRRVDGACLARRSWETAVELNPQLGRDIRILAVSPKVVPNAFAFRSTTDASDRKALIGSMQHIFAGPAGQQIAALYQTRQFVSRPIAVMNDTLEMVRQFERLTALQPHSRKGPA